MRAGISGEGQPRCKLNFGLGQQRRAGDYGDKPEEVRTSEDESELEESWGKRQELWSLDLHNLDLGLVDDKIERALRTAITNHILVMDDAKRRSYILVVPTGTPQALLSRILMNMFSSMPPPSTVTLFPVPIASMVAAGLRSALVVDIGWAETVITGVYEYREILSRRSSRGMKKLSWEVSSMLLSILSQTQNDEKSQKYTPSFEEVEEIVMRMIWCRKAGSQDQGSISTSIDHDILIPLNTKPVSNVTIPFERFAIPTEASFFPTSTTTDRYDDNETPLPQLIYNTLLALPMDVRHTCLQRVIFTGGGSHIPGLKTRLLAEVTHLIETRGWDPVNNYGSAAHVLRRHQVQHPDALDVGQRIEEATNKDVNPDSTTPAHLQPPLADPILATIHRRASQMATLSARPIASSSNDTPSPRLRSVATLGAWAGASLIAGLRIKGLVEIERERFLQYGLIGPEREEPRARTTGIAGVGVPRQVSYGSVVTPGPGHGLGRARHGWSLDVWA